MHDDSGFLPTGDILMQQEDKQMAGNLCKTLAVLIAVTVAIIVVANIVG
jgi:hypothetical protein